MPDHIPFWNSCSWPLCSGAEPPAARPLPYCGASRLTTADRMTPTRLHAWPPAPALEYAGRCAMEYLAARRLHASIVENASLRDLFDLSRMTLDVQADQFTLTRFARLAGSGARGSGARALVARD